MRPPLPEVDLPPRASENSANLARRIVSIATADLAMQWFLRSMTHSPVSFKRDHPWRYISISYQELNDLCLCARFHSHRLDVNRCSKIAIGVHHGGAGDNVEMVDDLI